MTEQTGSDLLKQKDQENAYATSPVEASRYTHSNREEQIVKKIRKANLVVFLRHNRHELFDDAFQQELASLYRPAERGHPPVAPAMLAAFAHSGSVHRGVR